MTKVFSGSIYFVFFLKEVLIVISQKYISPNDKFV